MVITYGVAFIFIPYDVAFLFGETRHQSYFVIFVVSLISE